MIDDEVIVRVVGEAWEGHAELLRKAIQDLHQADWDAFNAFVDREDTDYGVQDPCPIDAVLETAENVLRIAAELYPDEWARFQQEARRRLCLDSDQKSAKPYEKKKKISGRLRTAVFERDQYRCVFCGAWMELQADHIVPESKGGPTTLDNLQTLCRTCNQRKYNKVPAASVGE